MLVTTASPGCPAVPGQPPRARPALRPDIRRSPRQRSRPQDARLCRDEECRDHRVRRVGYDEHRLQPWAAKHSIADIWADVPGHLRLMLMTECGRVAVAARARSRRSGRPGGRPGRRSGRPGGRPGWSSKARENGCSVTSRRPACHAQDCWPAAPSTSSAEMSVARQPAAARVYGGAAPTGLTRTTQGLSYCWHDQPGWL